MDDVEKIHLLLKCSDPRKAQRKVHDLLGKDVKLYVSSRKDKKYMVRSPEGKLVHFGFMGMEDYTKHGDEARRLRFRNRNRKWATMPKYSAGWLAYHVLW